MNTIYLKRTSCFSKDGKTLLTVNVVPYKTEKAAMKNGGEYTRYKDGRLTRIWSTDDNFYSEVIIESEVLES